jgi:putative ABC transport system permease protein
MKRAKRALNSLDDDIRDHLERETQANIDRGLPPEEARRLAMVMFGNVSLVMEDTRRVWVWAWLDEARQDLRYATRTLLRNRAFAATAAATLAVAIGANTAMFSVLHAVLLRPLPYRSPEQLAMVWTEDPTQNIREGRSADGDVEEWRRQAHSFADMAVFDAVSRTLTVAGESERIVGASISRNLLPLLGVQPARGRSFSTDEADERQRVVLISHRFWLARFGGSTDAIGAPVVLDGRPSEIIGILPAGFQIARLDADVWEPHTTSEDRETRNGGGGTWFVVGRLRPTVTFDQAQAEMSALARRLNDRLPAADRNRGVSVVPLTLHLVGSQSRVALWMLGGAVFCVLLIAAANVASLALARSVGRAREMAVRAALGASAGRIVRQLLTESLMLTVVAGAIGTQLAVAAISLIRDYGPRNLARLDEVSLDLPVLGWALVLSLLAGVLVGLAPAITTVRRNLRAFVDEGGRSVSGGVGARGVRRALVVAECALAMVLLVGAGLLVRSWWQVGRIDAGFRPERVLAMELTTPSSFSLPAQRADLYDRVLHEIQAVPGVERAGIIGDMFIGNTSEQVLAVEGEGGTASERLRFRRDEVSPEFFTALGTPLRRGRFFSQGDGPGAPPVAIVNEAMAKRLWPGGDPVGRRFTFGARDSDRPWFTVVGVVGDMRRQGVEREPVPQMFVSLAQNPPRSVDLFIRTSNDDPAALAGSLRAAVSRVARQAPLYGVAPLEQQLGSYLAQRRFETALLIGFSLVAVLMAAIGIYGLIQYSIATRTQEIGLRLALGAQARDIFRMVIGEGLTLSLMGLALGLVGAWWLWRAASSLLYGVTATDPLTFMTVSLLLAAVAAAAGYFPARRAMKVDPIVALRLS